MEKMSQSSIYIILDQINIHKCFGFLPEGGNTLDRLRFEGLI